MKHAPEPWTLEIKGQTATIYDATGNVIGILADIELGWTDSSTGHYHNPEDDVGLLKLILACVNGCAGLNPAAYRQVVEALKKAQEDINWMMNNLQLLKPHAVEYIADALAMAEGRP